MRIQDGFFIENDLITKYDGNETELHIPSGVKGISASAFKNRSDIVSVYVPDGVEYIGREAFRGCENLKNIRLPDSITTITVDAVADTAYWNDENNWENGVLYIDNILVRAKDTLEGSYSVKPNTRMIVSQAFWRCQKITEVTMPNTVTNIGTKVFEYCGNLRNAILSERISIIPFALFSYCQRLVSITLPNITEIGPEAFVLCENLEKINFPETLQKIGAQAFWGCKKLKKIELPKTLLEIKEQAFVECHGLTTIELPFGLKSIAKDAFDRCSNMTCISFENSDFIPDISVKELCALKSIYTKANINQLPSPLKKYAAYGYIDRFMAGKTEHLHTAEYLAYIKRNRMKLLKDYSNDLVVYQFMQNNL